MDPNAALHRGRVLERNSARGDLARHFRVNLDMTSNPRRALRRMYVWHLGGSVALESDGVNADMDAFEDDDEFLPEDPVLLDELEALLDWVWDSYGPCGVYMNQDEREEIPERFNAWRESLGRNADGSLLRIVSFRAFGRWFLDLHQHFVYIRRHEAAVDIVMLEQHEEEDDGGDCIERHVEFKENHEEAHTSLMLERVVHSLLQESEKSIDEVHVYRGVQEVKEFHSQDEEKEEQYVKVTVKTIEDRLRKRSSRATPLNSSNWTPESVSPVDGTLTPYLANDADEELKEKLTSKVDVDDANNNNTDILWGEMCETCADFDDAHVEDSITGEPEDETEAWRRFALHLPVDDDDHHAEECITGDVPDDSSDDSDDFKAPAYEDKYPEDCIADASVDDDVVPWVLPTRKKAMDPRVGIAPPTVSLSVVSDAVDASMMRPMNSLQQQQQQQVIPVQQEQPRQVNDERVGATTPAVLDSPGPPPSLRMPSRQTLAQPVVRTMADATIDVAPVVLPPPPPAPPSLPARIEPMPSPSPLPALNVRGPPPQVRIPSRRVIVPTPSVPESTTAMVAALPPTPLMPMQEPTAHLPVDVAIETIQPVPVVGMPGTTATSDSPLTVRMPNVDEEERGVLVDVSELYNLWGESEYDAPVEDRQRSLSYGEDYLTRTGSGVFEYDDDDDERTKNQNK